jgi:hypothetical protein
MTQPATQTKPRTASMRWIKLGEGKDPDFDKALFLTDGKGFYRGLLLKIEQVSATEKKYLFNVGMDGAGEPCIVDYLTHYFEPVMPVK